MHSTSWKEHHALKNMDNQKLKWLENLPEQTSVQKPENLLPFLLAVNSHAQKKGIRFTDEETDVILCVLKENMSPEEQNRVDSMRKMLAGIIKK